LTRSAWCRVGWTQLVSLCVVFGLGLCGCQERSGRAPGEKLRVVVTTSLLADAVRQVAGDEVELTQLMPAGADPHSYTPIASDALALHRADLIFCHGLHLEGKMVEILKQRQAVAVGERLPASKLRRVDDGAEVDPHVWMDAKLWRECVAVILKELTKAEPRKAESFTQRGEAYLASLDALDQEIRQELSLVPMPQRVLVTSHDAFGYFGQAYGWEVRGLQGVSTTASLGTRDSEALVQFLLARPVYALYTETSTPSQGLAKVVDLV